jgi:hypothetical protein
VFQHPIKPDNLNLFLFCAALNAKQATPCKKMRHTPRSGTPGSPLASTTALENTASGTTADP